MNCSAIIRTGLLGAVMALAGGCGGDDKGSSASAAMGGASATGGVAATGGNKATGGASATGGATSAVTTGGSSASATGGTLNASGGSSAPATGGANVAGSTNGGGGAAGGTGPDSALAYFVKQANGTTTAALAAGVITVNSAYSASGNAFKYVAPNYYGTNSNGFIASSAPMLGDFSISAEVTITTQAKA